MILLPGLDHLLEQLTELRKTLIFTNVLKDLIKETDEPSERQGLGGPQVQELLPCGVGVHHHLARGCVQPGSFPNPYFEDIYGGFIL